MCGEEARDPLAVELQVTVVLPGSFVVDKLNHRRIKVFCFDRGVAVLFPPDVKDGYEDAALRIGRVDLVNAIDRISCSEGEQRIAAPFAPQLVAPEWFAPL